MTDPDLPEHVKRNRDLWDRWAKDYAQVGARAWAGAEPSWGIWSVPESELREESVCERDHLDVDVGVLRTEDFRAQWPVVPDNEPFDNGFKVQWEHFLRHVAGYAPFPWDFFAGARGVRLAELGLESARQGRRIEVPQA